ncbi:MAG: DUF2807 domain-containing protein [Bacteroidia bacterium]|nr:DUF2807 domain-containing protein [Bacteroidia bacterium]
MKTLIPVFLKLCLVLVSGLVLFPACEQGQGNQVMLSSEDLSEIGVLRLDAAADLEIIQAPKVRIELFDQNGHEEEIVWNHRGDELLIYSTEKVSFGFRKTPQIKLYTPVLPQRIDLEGSGEITSSNTWQSESLSVSLGGSGNVELKGSAKEVSADLIGSGKIELKDFKAEVADADLSGSGMIEMQANKHLKAILSGSGVIRYKGNPELVKEESGSGTISQID